MGNADQSHCLIPRVRKLEHRETEKEKWFCSSSQRPLSVTVLLSSSAADHPQILPHQWGRVTSLKPPSLLVPKFWHASESSGGLVKNRLLSSKPRISDSWSLCGNLRMCISSMFPSGANLTWETPLQNGIDTDVWILGDGHSGDIVSVRVCSVGVELIQSYSKK